MEKERMEWLSKDEESQELIHKALDYSKKAAVEAGSEIITIYEEGFSVREKEDHTPVTEADLKANAVILKHLQPEFPQVAFLSEESRDDLKRRQNPWCFIIDPLDGTKEFVKRSDEFTVNIALCFHGVPVMGLVYIPVSRALYYGVKGEGAFLQEGASGEAVRIHVSSKTEDIRAAVSKSNSPPNIGVFLKAFGIEHVIYAGSALKGCLIAEGKAELYYRSGRTCEWDTAAMQCIVEEAGGLLLQLDDTPLRYNRENVVNEKGFYILNRPENRLEDYPGRLSRFLETKK